MKNILWCGSVVMLIALPISVSAAVQSINGLTEQQQQLVSPGSNATNTMHMAIVTVGTDTHRFRWDGSPWRIDQGGTGVLTLPSGLLIGNGTLPLVSASVLAPLTFSANELGCRTADGTQSGCLSAADWSRFDTAANATSSGPAGSTREIQYNNAGAFGASGTFVFDASTGFLGVGTSTHYRPNERWEFVSETASPSGTNLVHTNYQNSGGSPFAAFSLRTARGTQSVPLAVQPSDSLGAITFSGFDGAGFVQTAPARIASFASGVWNTSAHGAGLLFNTTDTGSTVRLERMRIAPNGSVSIGTTTSNGMLTVDGHTEVDSMRVRNGSLVVLNGNILVGGINSPADKLNVHGNSYFEGNVSIGNTNLSYPLNISSSNETVVRIDSTSGSLGACLVMKDSDGDGYTYIRANNGALTASLNPC